jgi:DNA-binding MarR family transcriptional regulator
MNATEELASAWASYEKGHSEANVADFCRHYLAHQMPDQPRGAFVGGVIPGINEGLVLKVIGRIGKLNMLYASKALAGTEVRQLEEYGMLATIKQHKNPRKTDVITANLFELSSGTDMLSRLKSRGLIREYCDTVDKRSKRLELTEKGETTMKACYRRIVKNAQLMMHGISQNDMNLIVQMLKGIEIRFSRLWPQHKGKSFADVFNSIVQSGYQL